MKAAAILLLFFLPVLTALGQHMLPRDENGKVLFYEVVNTDALPKEAVYANVLKWLPNRTLSWQDESKKDGSYRLTATNSFPVYAKGYVSKQLHGTISYQLTIEVKDKRYRYYVNDFVFHYYQMDRNYKMVPTGRTKPLEDTQAAGWQKTWESHQAATQKAMVALADELKAALQNKVPTEEKKVTQVTLTENW